MMTFTSTKLAVNLASIRSRLAGSKIAARVSVPTDLDWWFYQEFGTATHFDEDPIALPDGIEQAPLPPSASPDFYVIRARAGGKLRLPITMHWPDAWEGPYVLHPGVAPKAFIRRILPDIHAATSLALAQALYERDYDPSSVQQALMSEIMPNIIQEIAASMAESLHGESDRDSPGKLEGSNPADVFLESASVVDISSE